MSTEPTLQTLSSLTMHGAEGMITLDGRVVIDYPRSRRDRPAPRLDGIRNLMVNIRVDMQAFWQTQNSLYSFVGLLSTTNLKHLGISFVNHRNIQTLDGTLGSNLRRHVQRHVTGSHSFYDTYHVMAFLVDPFRTIRNFTGSNARDKLLASIQKRVQAELPEKNRKDGEVWEQFCANSKALMRSNAPVSLPSEVGRYLELLDILLTELWEVRKYGFPVPFAEIADVEDEFVDAQIRGDVRVFRQHHSTLALAITKCADEYLTTRNSFEVTDDELERLSDWENYGDGDDGFANQQYPGDEEVDDDTILYRAVKRAVLNALRLLPQLAEALLDMSEDTSGFGYAVYDNMVRGATAESPLA